MEYIHPCKTEGKCQQLEFQDMGLPWYESYPKNGVIRVETDSPMGFPVWRGNYKCCTKCHLPLNQAESVKANALYGLTTKDIEEPDEDFMRLLNEF
jgi:hypothetical protein